MSFLLSRFDFRYFILEWDTVENGDQEESRQAIRELLVLRK